MRLVLGGPSALAYAHTPLFQRWMMGLSLGFICLGLTTIAALSWWPRQIAFNYAGATCLNSPVLLPELFHRFPSASYAVEPSSVWRVGSFPLFAGRLCITAQRPPQAHRTETVYFGLGQPGIRKAITITTPERPRVTSDTILSQPLATTASVNFQLSRADKLFTYQITNESQAAPCTVQQRTVSCPLEPLKLDQSATYDLTLERQFAHRTTEAALHRTISTIPAVAITQSSLAPGQLVLDVPQSITLTANKPLARLGSLTLTNQTDHTSFSVSATTTAEHITVSLSAPLPRNSQYELVIDALIGTDGSSLMQPYRLSFRTSEGPHVTGTNMPAAKASLTGNIVINLDAPAGTVAASQSFVKLMAGATTVSTQLATSGQSLSLHPIQPLARCTAYTIVVENGLPNAFGVTGGSAWSSSFRTICQITSSIGSSVQGRTITAYRFGTGANKIIVVGTTHGNEKSSTATLNAWIDDLESNYPKIPTDRTIIVVPNLNPDGYAANQRTNAHNVDLNRNFPANDWKAGVTLPNHSFLPTGGGTQPLSEPESQAIANLITTEHPSLVLTYHATAGIVLPNGAGTSVSRAQAYASRSNVRFQSDSAPTIFDYDTTGAFEGWLADKLNLPTLLIELYTQTSNEYSRHQAALWNAISS